MDKSLRERAAATPRQPSPLPMTVDEIDPPWLTSALCSRHPGVDVTAVDVLDVMPGSATKIRLRLAYGGDDATGTLPTTMVLKGGFDVAMRALAGELYRNEATFFDRVAPRLNIPLPTCFFAGSDPASGQSVVLLEDLDASGATFGHIESPLTPEVTRDLLDLLAGLHAQFWDDTDLAPVADLTGVGDGQRMVTGFLLGADNWARCRDLGRFAGLPADMTDRSRVASAIEALLETPGTDNLCLTHGDAHLGNLYFDRLGEPRLLDWQAARAGRWESDVAYAIVCALDTDVRPVHERDLLAHYLDRLAAHGVASPPTWDQAWLAYRRQAAYGILGLLCTPEMQSEQFARVMGRRFALAIEDLGSLEAIESG